MKSNRTAARVFGIFFILAFMAYGGGNGIVEFITSSPDGFSNVSANQNLIIFGAVLMAVVHTFLNIGLVVIMVPILKPYNKMITYGYLSAAIAATVMLIVGAIFLLSLVPLSDEYIKTGSAGSAYFQTLFALCKKANFFAYQIGMAIWGLGGLMFCYLLYQSKLVPRPITLWGFIGYVIFISGTMFELFGYSIGLLLDIPGGLFEIFLSVWLIAKGFNPSPVALGPAS